MKNSKKLGFTLIELLVVIAIIGILSGIISVQLSASRQKAKGAAVKQEMTSLRTGMEANRNSAETFDFNLMNNVGFTNIWNDIVKNSGGLNSRPGSLTFDPCSGDGSGNDFTACTELSSCNLAFPAAPCTKYVAIAKISAPNVTPSRWWCVDSQNKGKELVNGTGGFDVTTFGPSSGSCP